MRLWHYELLSVLPKKQLISQWRECCAIKRQWEKGTLKHRLVNYVMNYDKRYFTNYVFNVVNEMDKRKINFKEKCLDDLLRFSTDLFSNLKNYTQFIYPEHNDRYLIQCYYNLQEKYDRGIISKEDWKKIKEFVNIDYISIDNKNYYEIDGGL